MNTIQVANQALSHLRTKRTLQTFPDGSTEGETVQLFFDDSRRQLLRDFPFSWASRVVSLAEHTAGPPPDWQFRYAYPTDALAPRRVLVAGMLDDADEIPFTVELLPESDGLSLLCNVESAQLRYTADLVDIERWPVDAAYALTWLLAANMAPSLRGDAQLVQNFYAMYLRTLGHAIVNDGNSRREKPLKTARAVVARKGY